MYAECGGKCNICSKPEDTLCVDHCHKTGKIRGLLCFDCNTGLGKLGDDVQSIQRAIDYLNVQQKEQD